MNELERLLDDVLQGKTIGVGEAQFILDLNGIPSQLLDAAWRLRQQTMGREIRFYYPLPRFPSISVTGNRCSLNCKHCAGKYLKQMKAAQNPEALRRLLKTLDEHGATGCLVSGGSDQNGSVPLSGFYEVLAWAKEETDLIVNVHTGLVEEEEARNISETGIDIASLDFIGSEDTITRVIGLDKTPLEYLDSIICLKQAGIGSVVPHICVGLDWGQIRGEAEALGLLKQVNPETIVILGLRPTRGTAMQSAPVPSPDMIAKMIAATRLMFPSSSIALGCMIPHIDRGEVEALALKAGADRIVLPNPKTIKLAEERGLDILSLDACCAVSTELEKMAVRSSSS